MSDSKCEHECYAHDKCGERCGHGFNCNKSFYFVRWILGFIILATIFCTGIVIGKFAGQIERYDGYGSFGKSGYSRMMQYDGYNYAPIMMRGQTFQTYGGAEILPVAKTTVK